MRRVFESAGVPASKLSINDTPGKARADGIGVVAVQEGRGADFTTDEFSRFMSKANRLVYRFESVRYATSDGKCLIFGYDALEAMTKDYADTPAGKAGQGLQDPTKMSEDAESERFGVLHSNNGDGEYHVHDRENGAVYVVMLEGLGTSVKSVFGQDGGPDGDLKRAIVGAVIDQMPTYREAPDHYVSLEVNQSGGGGGTAGGAGSSEGSGSGGDDEEKDGFESVAGGDTEIAQLSDWIDAYTAVKSNLDPDCVDYDFGQASIPESWDSDFAGKTVEGVKIEASEPWGTDYHDGDSWTDKDGWSDHQTALREVMQNEDDVLYFGADYGYFNFVPKEAIDEVTS